MDQMIGNMFYRRVSPSEIKEMDFAELRYWDTWHGLISEAERAP